MVPREPGGSSSNLESLNQVIENKNCNRFGGVFDRTSMKLICSEALNVFICNLVEIMNRNRTRSASVDN